METCSGLPIVSISRLRLGIDGQGIRTLVVVYGCQLRCKYCFNPISWISSGHPKYYTHQQLFETVRIDDLYFQATNGGITFGGGEPMLYADYIEKFVNEYCAGWNIAIETSLFVEKEKVSILSNLIDHFYIDIKSLDKNIYLAYTGAPNDQVIDNLAFLSKTCPEKVTIRIPLIPGYNDVTDQQHTVEIMKGMGFSVNPFTYRTINKEDSLL